VGALCPLPAFDKFLTCNSPLAPAASFLPYMGKNHAWFPRKTLNGSSKCTNCKHENTGADHFFQAHGAK
jgi:hypothetical protein